MNIEPGGTSFIANGGEMGERIRSFPWSSTPLGPLEDWPQSLKTAVSICLNSRFPIVLWWGPELRLIYNDAWRSILGQIKHPAALGAPGREVWPEIWHIIGPMLQGVLVTGQATWSDDQHFILDRSGFWEETYFTYSYSPIREESGQVGGVFTAVNETTLRVVGERRLRTLRELAAQAAPAKTREEAGRAALATFDRNPYDVPFALLYLLDETGTWARLCCTAHIPQPEIIPSLLDIETGEPWPMAEVIREGRSVVVDNALEVIGDLAHHVWPQRPTKAVVLPLKSSGQDRVTGVLVMGVNPGRPFDDDHRSFFELAASHVAAAISSAHAYEEERKRAEALEELDRAKTAFFSNVSHEFRTPLTLMLGPIDDILARPAGTISEERNLLELVSRNGQRLLRLVNTLLDFSRIEAGRMQATYRPTDLARLTHELASVFRSACEQAGLALIVETPPLSEPVFVDREMWEKILLNLLSNAFKFTMEGSITVRLVDESEAVRLEVTDTGTGIPGEEIPRLFERFHRVQGTKGRTHEGSGIGLALVQELVHLHGGEVSATSEPGRGSTFTVRIPRGNSHLPADRLGTDTESISDLNTATPFVEEALRWLPPQDGEENQPPTSDLPATPILGFGEKRPLIVLADDNADMRHYVTRLLVPHMDVISVSDGEEALAAIRERKPDLVLTDVMMPRLDGFGLLKALREDAKTYDVPVIMLSARAGEESRIEGLEAGADDYLVKPFSARELLARVSAHLQLARLRQRASEIIRESEQRLQGIFDQMVTGIAEIDLEGRILKANPCYCDIVGREAEELIGTRVLDMTHPEDLPVNAALFERAVKEEEPFSLEKRYVRPDGSCVWVNKSVSIVRDSSGEPRLMVAVCHDISDRKRMEMALRDSEEHFRSMADNAPTMLWVTDPSGACIYLSRQWYLFTGLTPESDLGFGWLNNVHPDDREETRRVFLQANKERKPFALEYRLRRHDGVYRWVADKALPRLADDGNYEGFVGTVTDIHDRKMVEERHRLLSEAAELLLHSDDPDAMLRDLFWKIKEPLGLDAFFNYLLEGNQLRLASFGGVEEAYAKAIEIIDLDQALCGAVAQLRQPIYVPRVQEDQQAITDIVRRAGFRVYACNPLMVGDRLLGTLSFASVVRDELAPGELAFLETICRYVSVAYERLRLMGELRHIAAELSDANRRKDEFLATLAHELRNPLAPIRTGLHLMELAHDDAQAMEEARAIMERQLEHMVRLVDDLMDVSRITRGKIELRKETIPLRAAIQSAIETSTPLIHSMGHRLTVELPDDDIFVDADATRLAQVFANLLNNSAKYTERQGQINLTAYQDGEFAVVKVIDNGIGIPPEKLADIFNMFSQVDPSLERSRGGLGIGLTLVRRLVELHGGEVRAHSDGVRKGSTFEVRLPLAKSKTGTAASSGADDKREWRPLRVLVVDDNRDGAHSLAVMLRHLGHEVQVALNGVAGLQAFGSFRPDVMLLDIGMPEMNGYEVCRRIREREDGQEVVMIALTGWGQDEDRRRSKAAGFNDHLVKPVAPKQLERILAELATTRS